MDVPMHIRALQNLITLLQCGHTHLICFQSCTGRFNTIGDKCTRRTGWRKDSVVDECEHGIVTDFVRIEVEVLHSSEGEVI